MKKETRKYTSFVVLDEQYKFLYTLFGLYNSPAVFQNFINAVFENLIKNGLVLTYIDDLIIPFKSVENTIANLHKTLQVVKKVALNINWKKCKFLVAKVKFLGHIIKNGTVCPSEHKTEAVIKFPEPKNIKQLQSCLGLTKYFRKFIKDYALITRPLSDLLKKKRRIYFL